MQKHHPLFKLLKDDYALAHSHSQILSDNRSSHKFLEVLHGNIERQFLALNGSVASTQKRVLIDLIVHTMFAMEELVFTASKQDFPSILHTLIQKKISRRMPKGLQTALVWTVKKGVAIKKQSVSRLVVEMITNMMVKVLGKEIKTHFNFVMLQTVADSAMQIHSYVSFAYPKLQAGSLSPPFYVLICLIMYCITDEGVAMVYEQINDSMKMYVLQTMEVPATSNMCNTISSLCPSACSKESDKIDALKQKNTELRAKLRASLPSHKLSESAFGSSSSRSDKVKSSFSSTSSMSWYSPKNETRGGKKMI